MANTPPPTMLPSESRRLSMDRVAVWILIATTSAAIMMQFFGHGERLSVLESKQQQTAEMLSEIKSGLTELNKFLREKK